MVKRNERGETLIKFTKKNLYTLYKVKRDRKWTWISPDKRTKNEIDFILTNKPKQLKKIEVLNNVTYSGLQITTEISIKLQLHGNRKRSSNSRYINILQGKIQNLNTDNPVKTYHERIHQVITGSMKEVQSNVTSQRHEIISSES